VGGLAGVGVFRVWLLGLKRAAFNAAASLGERCTPRRHGRWEKARSLSVISRLRIDTVELSRVNDRKHDRGALSGVIKRAIIRP
jgi:hypothetical protein